MPYPKLSRRVAFAAKLEATPGAKTLPTVLTDAIRLLEVPTYEEFYLAENMTDEIITGKLGVLMLAPPGSRAMRIRGRSPIMGTTAAFSASNLPELDPIFVAAGFTRTLVTTAGSETVSYEPTDDPSVGATTTICAKLQMDGKEFVMYWGVVEEFSITADAAGFASCSWSIVGIMDPPVERDLPEATSFDATNFPVWKGPLSLVLNPIAAGKIFGRSFTLNVGNTASPRVDANSADGLAGYLLTGRVPQLDLRMEPTLLTDFNPRADWNARTGRKITISLGIGALQWNKLDIVMGDARVMNVVGADDNNLRYWDVSYRVTMPLSGVEPELRLQFK
jgi:hypothetical protein